MSTSRLILTLVVALASSVTQARAQEPGDAASGESGAENTTGAESDLAASALVAEDADPRALEEFRPVLDLHGEWYQHPAFGLVWVPSRAIVGDDFVPYLSHGRWALDARGSWVWQSDYVFGWVVFHYGRWVDVPGIGWAWIPGHLYSPAWVVWGYPTANVAYVAWAPMGPSFVWVDGVAVQPLSAWSVSWVFCRSQNALSPWLPLHVVKDEHRRDYLRRRTVVRTVEPPAEPPTNEWRAPVGRGYARVGAPPGGRQAEVTGERAPGAGQGGRGDFALPSGHREQSTRQPTSPGEVRIVPGPGNAGWLPASGRVQSTSARSVPPKPGDARFAPSQTRGSAGSQRSEPSQTTRLRQEPPRTRSAAGVVVRANRAAPPRRAHPPRAKARAKPAKLGNERNAGLPALRSKKSD